MITTQITRTCSCAHHDDGSVTTMLCPLHADNDPCYTMSAVTGRRRRGTIRKGVCTHCGHGATRSATWTDEADYRESQAGDQR